MARSMTAFARLETTGTWGRAIWELRSVNHRYLEVGLRLPEEFRVLEGEVRTRIGQQCNRGKVDAVLRFEASGPDTGQLRVNTELARQELDHVVGGFAVFRRGGDADFELRALGLANGIALGRRGAQHVEHQGGALPVAEGSGVHSRVEPVQLKRRRASELPAARSRASSAV